MAASLAKHINFLRSDHVMFWYHSHPVYRESLSAILLTDTGPFRGTMRECYHEVCDDITALNDLNLHFLQKTTNSLVATIVDLAKGSCDTGAPANIQNLLYLTAAAGDHVTAGPSTHTPETSNVIPC
ncbi:hypothetical protein HPB51_003954 [Rhipicephalus microplus]|uniref:Uncharacterized protein n=1 Tax=Rhipicephalus microplus TaxID=6941 RepID=A0A9J6D9A6_RHIMP|nr:hypothetical protein HPB51_003954 [Rhipicephalus microplus]